MKNIESGGDSIAPERIFNNVLMDLPNPKGTVFFFKGIKDAIQNHRATSYNLKKNQLQHTTGMGQFERITDLATKRYEKHNSDPDSEIDPAESAMAVIRANIPDENKDLQQAAAVLTERKINQNQRKKAENELRALKRRPYYVFQSLKENAQKVTKPIRVAQELIYAFSDHPVTVYEGNNDEIVHGIKIGTPSEKLFESLGLDSKAAKRAAKDVKKAMNGKVGYAEEINNELQKAVEEAAWNNGYKPPPKGFL